MKGFTKFLQEEDIGYVVVAFDVEDGKSAYLRNAFLNEGRRVELGRKDWMVCVGAEKPKIGVQRHAHIARATHINAKNMHASWKEDGTRIATVRISRVFAQPR